MGKMSNTGKIVRPKDRSGNPDVPSPARRTLSKSPSGNRGIPTNKYESTDHSRDKTSAIERSGALGKGQDAEPGAPTRDTDNGGSTNKSGMPFNYAGAGANGAKTAGGIMSSTFPPLDVGAEPNEAWAGGGKRSGGRPWGNQGAA